MYGRYEDKVIAAAEVMHSRDWLLSGSGHQRQLPVCDSNICRLTLLAPRFQQK